MINRMFDDMYADDLGGSYSQPYMPTPAASTTTSVAPKLTPLQEYNQKDLAYYQGKSLSDYDQYGGYSMMPGLPGVSSAAMMDPDVAGYFNSEWQGQGAYPAAIQQKIAAANSLYQTQGWNGVLQHAKDIDVGVAQGGYDMSMAHPEKELTTGFNFGWDDVKLIAAMAATVFGGGSIAAGMMGSGAGAAGAAAGAAGAGEAAGGLGAIGSSGLGAATAAGLDASIPSVFVTGSAAGAGGLGAGAVAAGAAGAAGLGSMMSGGGSPAPSATPAPSNTVDPNIPTVNVTAPAGSYSGGIGAVGAGSLGTAGAVLSTLGNTPVDTSATSQIPNVQSGGTNIPESALPPLVMPNTNQPVPVTLPADGMATNPATGGLLGGTPVSSIPNPNPSGGTTGTTLPGGINAGSVLGGLGSLFSGYQDYKMNQADMDYYQGLLNKMMGMYQPGTPEAGLMQHQMEAKDAAAGRNSQYGVRADNLAAQLAGQRAQIMTSPTFGKLAEASRGHYDSSLASLSSMLGGATTTGNPLNTLINTGINTGASWLNNLFS